MTVKDIPCYSGIRLYENLSLHSGNNCPPDPEYSYEISKEIRIYPLKGSLVSITSQMVPAYPPGFLQNQ
jgi:hypothetical protein